MSDIGFGLRKLRLEIAWAAFALLNIGAMFIWPSAETVPFHFIWVSLTLLYGLRTWPVVPTLVTLGAVMLGTGAAVAHDEVGFELTEIPLMAAMFLVMVWHARRRQRAIEDLAAAAERERDFLRDASHKLRTPIAIAQGHTELIREASSVDGARADAEVVLDELGNLSRISDRILSLAVANHPEDTRIEPASVGAMLERTVDRWRAAADRRWEIELSAEMVACVDVDRVEEAIDAIVENAVKYTGTGDPIRLGARIDGADVVIEIEDGGTGISARDLPYVFDRFYGGGSGAARGTGLGLAIARSVAEAHGGRAMIRSTLGQGTTVTLCLPASRTTDLEPAARATLA